MKYIFTNFSRIQENKKWSTNVLKQVDETVADLLTIYNGILNVFCIIGNGWFDKNSLRTSIEISEDIPMF